MPEPASAPPQGAESVRTARLACLRLHPNAFQLFKACVAVVFFLAAGLWYLEPSECLIQQPLDALYLAIMSLTTVGLGDLCPKGDAAKILLVLVCIPGIHLVAAGMDVIGASLRRWLYRITPGTSQKSDLFWATVLVVIMLSAGVAMCRVVPDQGFPTSLVDQIYFATILASTVGYGDFSPVTDLGKGATVCFALVSVSCWSFTAAVYGSWIKENVFGIRGGANSNAPADKFAIQNKDKQE